MLTPLRMSLAASLLGAVVSVSPALSRETASETCVPTGLKYCGTIVLAGQTGDCISRDNKAYCRVYDVYYASPLVIVDF